MGGGSNAEGRIEVFARWRDFDARGNGTALGLSGGLRIELA
jgi:hypothetical protein